MVFLDLINYTITTRFIAYGKAHSKVSTKNGNEKDFYLGGKD